MALALSLFGALVGFGSAIWFTRRTLKLRRTGVRAPGWVLRHERKLSGDYPKYAAVIGFADEYGAPCEFESSMRGGSPTPDVGTAVPVIYLPGRPSTAQEDTRSHVATSIAVMLSLGLAGTAAAIYLVLHS